MSGWAAEVEQAPLPGGTRGPAITSRGRIAALRAVPSDQRSAWLAGSVAIGLLVFLTGPLAAAAQARQPALDELLLFGAIGGFVGLYLWAIPSDLAGRPDARPARAAVVLTLLAVGVALTEPRLDWTVLFIATGTAAGRIRPSRAAATATVIIAALATLVLLAAEAPLIDGLESGFEVILTGLVVFSFSQLERTITELRRAQAQAARLAAADERLRIARDVHDLLGHSLSIIALKVELAGRLVERDPRRAAEELRDVEGVTRGSLRDVREAVAGYRRITLDTELAGARMALSAAGVNVDIGQPAGHLDEETDSLLGWIVREGVTNVVRHSGGTHCAIRVATAGREVRLEVVDDGRPDDPHRRAAPNRVGSGLSGIRERVEAIGGRMEAGPLEGRGFRLAAYVPISVGDGDGGGAA